MRLELASYPVETIALEDAVEQLSLDDPCFARVERAIVRPGEPVRITHVLDAVEPRVKADEPEATFPGALGVLRPAGSGRTHRIAGCAVLACADNLDFLRELPSGGVRLVVTSPPYNIGKAYERRST